MLPNKCIFGLLLSFNDMVMTQPKALLTLLGKFVSEQMPRSGSIICYDSNGDLVFANNKFSDDVQAVENLRSDLTALFTQHNRGIGCRAMTLPQMQMPHKTINVENSLQFSKMLELMRDENSAVVISLYGAYQNDATFAIISGLKKQIEERNTTIAEQHDTIRGLERTRKQYRIVLGLLACLCVAGFGLYRLNNNLNATTNSLAIANDTIDMCHRQLVAAADTIATRGETIRAQDITIARLEDRYASLAAAKRSDSINQTSRIASLANDVEILNQDKNRLNTRLHKTESDLSSAKNKSNTYRTLGGIYPFLCKSCTRSGSTLSISYNSVKGAENVKVNVRTFSKSSYLGQTEKTVTINEGSGVISITSVPSLSSAAYIIVYANGLIVGGAWF